MKIFIKNLKNKLLITLFIYFFVFNHNCFAARFLVAGGFNFSNLEYSSTSDSDAKAQPKAGSSLGAQVEWPFDFDRFSFDLGFFLMTRSIRWSDGNNIGSKDSILFAKLPFGVKYYLNSFVNFGLGLYGARSLSNVYRLEASGDKSQIKGATYGLPAFEWGGYGVVDIHLPIQESGIGIIGEYRYYKSFSNGISSDSASGKFVDHEFLIGVRFGKLEIR